MTRRISFIESRVDSHNVTSHYLARHSDALRRAAGSGEMEAFCELFFDNLATLLGVTGTAMYIGSLSGGSSAAFKGALSSEWARIYYEWHIPACGIGLLFGNIWFAWLATRLAAKENRLDVTAQQHDTTVIHPLFAICFWPAGWREIRPRGFRVGRGRLEMGKRRPSTAGRCPSV